MGKRKNKGSKVPTYGLPAEIAAGKTILRIMNQNGCILEGIYQIETYSDTVIHLKVSWGGIRFCGKEFVIEQMDGALISFTGRIERIDYLA